jgi:molybdenum cofactor cytidylyltransferase
MPRLSNGVIDLLIQRRHEHPGRIVVPTLGERRGHPILIPWSLVKAVHALAEDEGLNSLVEREAVVVVAADHVTKGEGDPFLDLDTPAQFAELAHHLENITRDDGKP